MRKRNKTLLFLLLLILLLLLLLLSLPFLFPDLFKEGKPVVKSQLQAQPAVQEQAVEQPAVQEQEVYKMISSDLIKLGLAKEKLTSLTDKQQGLLNDLVNVYLKEPLNLAKKLSLFKEIKKEFQLTSKPKSYTADIVSVSSETESSEESTIKKVMDFSGALIDAVHGSLKKVPIIPLVGVPGLAG